MAPTPTDTPVGTTVRDPGRARAAHLLRRLTLAAPAPRVDDVADLDLDTARAHLLQVGPIPRLGPVGPDDWDRPVRWFVDRLTGADADLRDRMAWFWHGLLTTDADAAGSPELVATQIELLYEHALGNYRALLAAFLVDGALLVYLDGDGSIAANPNENLARELMELFTIGRGTYSQDDVRAAARALAGWVVDRDDGDGPPRVRFAREHAFVAPLVYLGEQADWDTGAVVDRLCDHPATARRVATRLWGVLVGTELDQGEAEELGGWWQRHDLEITPLVERIVDDDRFVAPEVWLNRHRPGLEWYAGVRRAADLDVVEPWDLHQLGQLPYAPPSPAGWPEGPRWSSGASLLARAGLVWSLPADELVGRYGGSAADVLARCGLHQVSAATEAALAAIDARPDLAADERGAARWRTVLLAPEAHRA